MQDETLEITFGVAEECNKIRATVSSLDDWLVDNKKIKVEFTGDGYCTVYVTPKEGQYGDCIMTVHVQDPVGSNSQSFPIQFMVKKKKIKGTKTKHIEISEMDRILGNDQKILLIMRKKRFPAMKILENGQLKIYLAGCLNKIF